MQGQRIQDLRKAKGLTQKELGELVGAAEGTVRHWESGLRPVNKERLTAIAHALGVEYHDARVPPPISRQPLSRQPPATYGTPAWKAYDAARGSRIRTWRENAGLTRDQLAGLAGSSRNTIESYEKGQPFKQRASAERLAAVAGWSLADLLGIPEEASRPTVLSPAPISKARRRVESPLTRGDLASLHARMDELSASYDQAQRDQFEQLAGRISDLAGTVGTPPEGETTSLHEALSDQQRVLLLVLGQLDELAEAVEVLRRRGSSEGGEGEAGASPG